MNIVGILLGGGSLVAFFFIGLGVIGMVSEVWSGERQSVNFPSIGYAIDVNVRNYVAWAVFMFSICIVGPLWVVLRVSGVLANSEEAGGVVYAVDLSFGLIVAIGVLVFFPLTLFINAFNRPKFLVPPPHRDESGWVAQWLSRLWNR